LNLKTKYIIDAKTETTNLFKTLET